MRSIGNYFPFTSDGKTIDLLLARGCDRLETSGRTPNRASLKPFSYSLGDAIDWKHISTLEGEEISEFVLLLARGCDRLETNLLPLVFLV